MHPPKGYKPYYGDNPTANQPPESTQLLERGKTQERFDLATIRAYSDDALSGDMPEFNGFGMGDPRHCEAHRKAGSPPLMKWLKGDAPDDIKEYCRAALRWCRKDAGRFSRYPWVRELGS